MNVYLDASILLRFIFAEPDPLAEWHLITRGICSSVVHVECRRAIDRERLATRDAKVIARYRNLLLDLVENIDFLTVTSEVIAFAAQPYPFVVRTLDAVHLGTALDWRRRYGQDLAFATHDGQLANAARAVGFHVLGR